MGVKSITIVRAVTADFFFDCRAAEVPSDEWIRDVPWGHNDAQDLRLESFQNFNVGGWSSAPELYTVGPVVILIVALYRYKPEKIAEENIWQRRAGKLAVHDSPCHQTILR
jgi:hypothetical protein